MQNESPHPFKINYSMDRLEDRFMWEDRQMNIFDYIKESEVV